MFHFTISHFAFLLMNIFAIIVTKIFVTDMHTNYFLERPVHFSKIKSSYRIKIDLVLYYNSAYVLCCNATEKK